MPQSDPDAFPNLAALRDAPWLKTTAIARVFATLASTGAVSRVVGGAVRNTLLAEPVDDIDIATAATPDQVLAAAGRAGLSAIPTGLQHGTVTLVADATHYEVTTLRRDVDTDGRHATIAFTDDWALDAARRDFTINALYCDPDGTLFDPLGGTADLVPPRVRFIGHPRQRICEDYLRILRFFRFSARYMDGGIDADGVAACDLERAGLSQISAERVRVEMLKLLSLPHGGAMCRIMQAHGFVAGLLGVAPSPARVERLAAIEAAVGAPPDPLLRLAALTLYPASDATALAARLRLSGAERDRLATIAAEWGFVRCHPNLAADRRVLYRRGVNGFRDALLLAWAGSDVDVRDEAWRARLAGAAAWVRPRLPVAAKDVMALGVAAGPELGRLLATIEAWWMAHDFGPDRADCLAELTRLARA